MMRHTHTQLIAYAADDNAIIFWLHGRSQLLIRASPGAAANTSATIFHLTPQELRRRGLYNGTKGRVSRL
jgi:hypothetical protein